MKKFLLVVAMSAAALGTSSAMSSPAGSTPRNTLDVQEVNDRTLLPARAAEQHFKSVRGQYLMDDGTTLRVYRDSNGYAAQVSGQEPVSVAVTRRGELVSPDRAIEIRFQKNDGGLYDSVVLSKLNQGAVSIAGAGQSNKG